MFEKLLNVTRADISTVRSVIKTNEKLREIFFEKGAITKRELDENTDFSELFWSIPNAREWRIYDHCAVITRLYAIYENFVESLIRDWILLLPDIFPCYSDLAEQVRSKHQLGVAQLLQELKRKKSRFNHLSVESIVRGLYFGFTAGEGKYDLVPDAFLLHDQNLRKEALGKLFTDAGISNSWNWVKNHRDVRNFVKEVIADENTVEGELNELISYRNDAAHGAAIDNWLGSDRLLYFCELVEVLCNALAELTTYSVVERKKSIGKVKQIGKVTRWFEKAKATRAKIQDAILSVGTTLFLVSETKYWCNVVKVESIKILEEGKEIEKNSVEITNERELGLKFNAEAKKDLLIYIELSPFT
ncbi:MAG: MAE_28990/MAE_18760 family HEPN-like nuclease [Oscillatoria sp. PMC 1051.18]|nr:MAE_28990/MAE_18760 family HEPN-like nuclease [Oscillatoria sp. PMC 1050.18]MEC5032930.1 MAE_28990/MAE_18760 family HEPN-like nuclease [Oscillatoria sp. PMC 1051.18]